MKDSTKNLLRAGVTYSAWAATCVITGIGLRSITLKCKNKATALAWLLGGSIVCGYGAKHILVAAEDYRVLYRLDKECERIDSELGLSQKED